MDNLQSQLEWEKQMMAFGIERFRHGEHKTKERGMYHQTQAGSKILKSYLNALGELVANYCAGNLGRRGKHYKLVQTIQPDKVAMFTIVSLMQSVYEGVSMAKVTKQVGTMLEDELRFSKFKLEKPELFVAMQSAADARNSTDYRYRHRKLTHAMTQHNIEWRKWDSETIHGTGTLCVNLALSVLDFIEKRIRKLGKKSVSYLIATEEARQWVMASDDAVSLLMPYRMPCIIPPNDWVTPWDGGYLSPEMRNITPLVKVKRGCAGKEQDELLGQAHMPGVLSAVNTMQKTAWRVNTRVLDTLTTVWEGNMGLGMPSSRPLDPPISPFADRPLNSLTEDELSSLRTWKREAKEIYALEKKRQGEALTVARAIKMSRMMQDQERFYFVYQLDFRGRIYAATTEVNPQGGDQAKATLEFAEGKRLGSSGAYWLKVHGANKYGYDKVNYDDRVKWVDDQKAVWCAVADDPLTTTIWVEADKPYQFLAFCFEYAEYVRNGEDHISHLPVALDGSCNGLQHFSAMLRDEVGGKAVNLTPSAKPEDIYQNVADVCYRKLCESARTPSDVSHLARNWVDLFKSLGIDGVPRTITKKPVMTLPYGSTQNSCTTSIYQWYIENGESFLDPHESFNHCVYFSKILWGSIRNVVVAATAAMDWLQAVASKVSKCGVPLGYISPLGFPVYQSSTKTKEKKIRHVLGGSAMSVTIRTDLDELDCRKQRQGSSPNFVHHVDATHLMMTVNAAASEGITDFAMIHDDFGCHAAQVDSLQKVTREQFVRLYTENDLLRNFKETQEHLINETLMDLPATGKLEIQDVKKSLYFFG